MKYSELHKKLKEAGCYPLREGGGITPFGLVQSRVINFLLVGTKAKK